MTPERHPDLIVVGDVMLDVSVSSDALARGGDVHGDVRVRPGGSGANAAAWAAWGGARVELYGAVGEDPTGRLLLDALPRAGVSTRLRTVPEVRTGAMLVVRHAGERSMVADRGANACLSPDDLPPVLRAGAVLVSGYLLYDPGSEPAARAALGRAASRWVAVDAASWPLVETYGPGRFLEAVRGVTVLLANEDEARVLAGLPSAPIEEVAAGLADGIGLVAVKRDRLGAVMATGGRTTAIASPSIVEVDPTAAGDAFDGVFLAALARGAPPERALEEACAVGARAAASGENWPSRGWNRS